MKKLQTESSRMLAKMPAKKSVQRFAVGGPVMSQETFQRWMEGSPGRSEEQMRLTLINMGLNPPPAASAPAPAATTSPGTGAAPVPYNPIVPTPATSAPVPLPVAAPPAASAPVPLPVAPAPVAPQVIAPPAASAPVPLPVAAPAAPVNASSNMYEAENARRAAMAAEEAARKKALYAKTPVVSDKAARQKAESDAKNARKQAELKAKSARAPQFSAATNRSTYKAPSPLYSSLPRDPLPPPIRLRDPLPPPIRFTPATNKSTYKAPPPLYSPAPAASRSTAPLPTRAGPQFTPATNKSTYKAPPPLYSPAPAASRSTAPLPTRAGPQFTPATNRNTFVPARPLYSPAPAARATPAAPVFRPASNQPAPQSRFDQMMANLPTPARPVFNAPAFTTDLNNYIQDTLSSAGVGSPGSGSPSSPASGSADSGSFDGVPVGGEAPAVGAPVEEVVGGEAPAGGAPAGEVVGGEAPAVGAPGGGGSGGPSPGLGVPGGGGTGGGIPENNAIGGGGNIGGGVSPAGDGTAAGGGGGGGAPSSFVDDWMSRPDPAGGSGSPLPGGSTSAREDLEAVPGFPRQGDPGFPLPGDPGFPTLGGETSARDDLDGFNQVGTAPGQVNGPPMGTAPGQVNGPPMGTAPGQVNANIGSPVVPPVAPPTAAEQAAALRALIKAGPQTQEELDKALLKYSPEQLAAAFPEFGGVPEYTTAAEEARKRAAAAAAAAASPVVAPPPVAPPPVAPPPVAPPPVAPPPVAPPPVAPPPVAPPPVAPPPVAPPVVPPTGIPVTMPTGPGEFGPGTMLPRPGTGGTPSGPVVPGYGVPTVPGAGIRPPGLNAFEDEVLKRQAAGISTSAFDVNLPPPPNSYERPMVPDQAGSPFAPAFPARSMGNGSLDPHTLGSYKKLSDTFGTTRDRMGNAVASAVLPTTDAVRRGQLSAQAAGGGASMSNTLGTTTDRFGNVIAAPTMPAFMKEGGEVTVPEEQTESSRMLAGMPINKGVQYFSEGGESSISPFEGIILVPGGYIYFDYAAGISRHVAGPPPPPGTAPGTAPGTPPGTAPGSPPPTTPATTSPAAPRGGGLETAKPYTPYNPIVSTLGAGVAPATSASYAGNIPIALANGPAAFEEGARRSSPGGTSTSIPAPTSPTPPPPVTTLAPPVTTLALRSPGINEFEKEVLRRAPANTHAAVETPMFMKEGGEAVSNGTYISDYLQQEQEKTDSADIDPLGTAQKYLTDLTGATKKLSPVRQSIKRPSRVAGGAESSKEMNLKLAPIAVSKQMILDTTSSPGEPKNTDSARAQMEAFVEQYKRKIKIAKNKARGLQANTLGAPTLEAPTLTRNTLAKKTFAEGGEAKKLDAEVAEPSLFGVSDYATKASARMFPDQLGQDDQRDAARHMLAAGIVARKFGPKAAELLGKAHEYTSNPQTFFSAIGIGKPRDDLPYDMHNNRIGAELAARATSQAELEALVKAMALQAQTKQTEGKPYIMSREQLEARKAKAEKGPAERPEYRAEGSPEEGEVSQEELDAASRPAFVTPKSGKGRKEGEISKQLKSGDAYANMAKGVTELPYDLAGAGVDLATMAMRPFGYSTEKPVMGSDWIKEQMTGSKAYQVRPEPPTDPTAKGFYTAGELLSNLVNPAGAVRAGVKGAEKVGQAATNVGKDFLEYNRQISVPGASYAVPPQGPAKTPAPASGLGFYSAAEQAALNLPRKEGSGAAFLNDLMKAPDVKKEELSAMGLDEFLKSKPKATREEVQDFIANNRLDVKEVQFGNMRDQAAKKEQEAAGKLVNLINAQDGASIRAEGTQGKMFSDEALYALQDGTTAPSQFPVEFQGAASSYLKAYEAAKNALNTKTKFDPYQLPGGENYREILLTIPGKKPPPVTSADDPRVRIEGSETQGWEVLVDGKTVQSYKTGVKESSVRDYALADANEAIERRATRNQYRSSHFDEPNILAHMRVNDRVDADGKKMLLIEELQSDWHQAGREQGYKTGKERNSVDVEKELNITTQKRARLLEEAAALPDSEMAKFRVMNEEIRRLGEQATKLNEEWTTLLNKPEGVPDAPFKDTWHQLALKRALKYAADNGYERVGLTTGKQQSQRYNMSTQVDNISYEPTAKGFYINVISKDGPNVLNGDYSVKELEGIVGKELTQKMLAKEGKNEFDPKIDPELAEIRRLDGVDLQLEDKGMKKYYDEIYPAFLAKQAKKYGAQVGETNIRTQTSAPAYVDYVVGQGRFNGTTVLGVRADGSTQIVNQNVNSLQEAQQLANRYKEKHLGGGKEAVRYIDITPEMQGAVPYAKGGMVDKNMAFIKAHS